MTKPTLGPFKVELEPTYGNATIYGKGRQHVATVWSGNKNPSMAVVKANAALLAASPAMLEAILQTISADGAHTALSALKTADGRTGWQALWDASYAAQDVDALDKARAKRR